MAEDAADILDQINPEAVIAMTDGVLMEGYVPQDFAEVTDEEMEAAYATALNLINSSKFDQAEKAFAFLGYMNQYEGKYWLGLGVARQMQQKYDEAVKAYATAGVYDVGNPIPPLRAAECFVALGRLDEAEQSLSAVDHWCGQEDEFAAIRDRAAVLLEGIQKKKGN